MKPADVLSSAEAPIDASPAAGALGRATRLVLRKAGQGTWPVVGGLVGVCVVFQLLNDRFLTPQNLYFLTLQNAPAAVIAIGIVLVLLVGEIDLSAGYVSGVAGAALGVLTVREGLPDWAGIVGAVALGSAIGTLQGGIVAWLRVPSFVVTLAGLIGWMGLQLWLLGDDGTINFRYDGFIGRITHTDLSRPLGWSLGALVVIAYAVSVLSDRRRRLAAALEVPHRKTVALRIGGLAAGVLGPVAVLDAYQGVPVALVLVVGLAAGLDLLLRRTRFGRGLIAVGGNTETARRAGIRVTRVRVAAFSLCSTLAAVGGILAASRSYAVGQSSGGFDVLLMAVAAAVIGGTSLFGGRGRTYSALLGMLVLGAIQSGLLLLQLGTEARYMITAVVLLGAVALDSIARRAAS